MARTKAKNLYIDIKTTDTNYYIDNGRVKVISVLVMDIFSKVIFKGDNLEQLDKYLRENITETTNLNFYGDKALHSILPYLYKNVGETKINYRTIKNTIMSISWSREIKRKKFTIKFVDISRTYPTINVNREDSSETTLNKVINYILGEGKKFFTGNGTVKTLNTEAWNKWRDSTAFGRDIAKWLQVEKLDHNGEPMYNEKGKPIMEANIEVWNKTKQAFNGGFLYVNPEYQMKIIKEKLHKWDMNSMYAHIMMEYKHPIGEPIYEDNEHYTYKMYKVRIKRAETQGIPFITVGQEVTVKAVYESLMGETGGDIGKDNIRPKVIIDKEVYMNNYTFEYFEEMYEGTWEKEFVYACEEEYDIFTTYLEEILQYKVLFNDNKELRNHFKQMIVTPYGKTAQQQYTLKGAIDKIENVDIEYTADGREHINGQPIYHNDGLVYYQEDAQETNVLSYIPIAQSIASKSEIHMLKILNKNPDKVVYVDTDGFITTEKYGWGFEVDDTEVGAFKYEGCWESGVIRGFKHYMLRNRKEVDFKAAGVYKKLIDLNDLTLDKYVQPEVPLGPVQFMRQVVDGGIVEWYQDMSLTDQRVKRLDTKRLNIKEKKEDIREQRSIKVDTEYHELFWSHIGENNG